MVSETYVWCGNTRDRESSFVMKTTLLGADCPDACVHHLTQLRKREYRKRIRRREKKGEERIAV